MYFDDKYMVLYHCSQLSQKNMRIKIGFSSIREKKRKIEIENYHIDCYWYHAI